MSTNRNEFLASLQFNIPTAIEEYSRYLYEYKQLFFEQVYDAHVAIMQAFPEVDFHTIYRIKSFDSSLNKVRKKSLEKVFDFHGMKHILHAVNDNNSESILTDYCYRIKDFLEDYYSKLGITILSSRTKDYIASPKENDYQAIHLSGMVVNQNNRKFETQIKTAQMEEVAKYGNANHAEKYKPRALGNFPHSMVPHYGIVCNVDGKPVNRVLNFADCFQYYYNISYDDYMKQQEKGS